MKRYEGIASKEIIIHKKRTAFTLLSIIFSLAMLVLVGEINNLNYRSDLAEIKYRTGDTHGKFRNINGKEASLLENNSLVEKVGYSYRDEKITRVDYSSGGYSEKIEEIIYADKKYFENILVKDFFKIEGRIPISENEVIIINNTEPTKKIGAKEKVNGKDREIVGFLNTIQEQDFTDFKILGISDVKAFKKINASVKLVERENIQKGFEAIGKDMGALEYVDKTSEEEVLKEKKLIDLNIELLKIIGEKVQIGRDIYYPNKIDKLLQGVLIVALVILTYISVNASVKEKRKTYSMLKCIGASNGQIRKLILRDGFIISIISIIPGIALGEIVFNGMRENLLSLSREINFDIPHKFNLEIIGIAIALVFIVILLASLAPMIWINYLSPIESLRGEKIKGQKKPIKSKFVRKIFGYEGELAYKNLKADKSNFIGLTMTIIIVLVVFNVFTMYYKYDIFKMKLQNGVMSRDITLQINGEDKVKDILSKYKEFGEYAKITGAMPLIRIEGIDREIIKDSQCYNDYNKEKNIITSRSYGPSIYVLNDKAFNDLKPYVKGEGLTLENFKDNGAIYFSNNDEGAIYPPKEKNKIKLYINDEGETEFENFWGPNSEIGKFKVPKNAKTKEIELNILGVTPLETLLSERMAYGGALSGVIISEEVAKGLNLKVADYENNMYIYEFKNEELRKKYLDRLDKEIEVEVKKDIFSRIYANTAKETEENKKAMDSYALVMYSILGFIVVMLILGIVNIRDIALNNRKKDFGTMFAIGMDKKMLRKSLIYEGVIQGIIALILGNSVTVILMRIIALNLKGITIVPGVMIVGSVGVILVCILNIFNSIRKLSNKEAMELIKEIN